MDTVTIAISVIAIIASACIALVAGYRFGQRDAYTRAVDKLQKAYFLGFNDGCTLYEETVDCPECREQKKKQAMGIALRGASGTLL